MTGTSAPLKVLVIRFSSIGDIVLCSPVIRALKQQLQAEVHVLTKRSYQGILEANPYVDRVFGIEKEVTEFLPLLRGEKYDRVIDLHHNLRSWRVKLSLGVKSHAFDKINLQKWLMVRFKLNFLPRRHIVDRYLDAAGGLGLHNDGAGLDYFIPSEADISREALAAKAGFYLDSSFVALVIGAAHATKRLPEDRLIDLCNLIRQPVILLGGPEDRQRGDVIASIAGGKVWNGCGQFSLHQSAAVVRQAAVVVTHDTGLMHIAAALGRPIIAIWGNTIPEFGMYPYDPAGVARHRNFEVPGLRCRPCSKIGYEHCPKGNFRCMREQPLDEIAAAVVEVFGEKN